MVNGQKRRLDLVRGQGMTVDDIYFKEINGVEYAHVKKFIEGKETIELLPELKDIDHRVLLSRKICVGLIKIFAIFVQLNGLVALIWSRGVPFSITNVQTDRLEYGSSFSWQ